MKVLVTSGATREPIDSVRYITNLSSGRTGAAIAEELVARGWVVSQLHGMDSAVAAGVARCEAFTDHVSLDRALRDHLEDGGYDAVIHAAAVGDYTVADAAAGAKHASGQELVLRLLPTAKIIDRIRVYAGRASLVLVGFKLTHDADVDTRAQAARSLLERSGADYVVQNDVATLGDGAGHVYVIHARNGGAPLQCSGRRALAAALAALLEQATAGSPA